MHAAAMESAGEICEDARRIPVIARREVPRRSPCSGDIGGRLLRLRLAMTGDRVLEHSPDLASPVIARREVPRRSPCSGDIGGRLLRLRLAMTGDRVLEHSPDLASPVIARREVPRRSPCSGDTGGRLLRLRLAMTGDRVFRRLPSLASSGLWVAALIVALLAASGASAQSVSINLGDGNLLSGNLGAGTLTAGNSGGGQSMASNVISILALTSVLALAPGILVMGTSFTRLVVVLSMLRTALGLQSSPPNTVIVSLALFLTAFIMGPTFETAYRDGLQPMMQGSITEEQGLDRSIKPFRGFMEANVSNKDLALFIELSGWKPEATPGSDPAASQPDPGAKLISTGVRDQLPLRVLCSAFLVSELSKAFQIGFLLFLPFLVIDIAVGAILMGMGMMMLPPIVVSLPIKLVFFVLVSGWEMVAGSLVRSFTT
jgi:flagellar biosynthesis protein FliP